MYLTTTVCSTCTSQNTLSVLAGDKEDRFIARRASTRTCPRLTVICKYSILGHLVSVSDETSSTRVGDDLGSGHSIKYLGMTSINVVCLKQKNLKLIIIIS